MGLIKKFFCGHRIKVPVERELVSHGSTRIYTDKETSTLEKTNEYVVTKVCKNCGKKSYHQERWLDSKDIEQPYENKDN